MDSYSGSARILQEDEYYIFGLRHGFYDASNNNRPKAGARVPRVTNNIPTT